VIADDVGVAADFLEEYALRPPGPSRTRPRSTLPPLAGNPDPAAGPGRPAPSLGLGSGKVYFVDSDAQFLETQSSRLFRMHHWIKARPTHS
jgi:hypothetical protein